jgi:hypothetical protein
MKCEINLLTSTGILAFAVVVYLVPTLRLRRNII